MKVFLYVQHLLGIGHLKRASVIAGALARAGGQVTVASGGAAVTGFFPAAVRLLQLPPASAADASFRMLVDERGQEVDQAWKAQRRQRLVSAFEEAKPDCLLIELFPFGRRQMRFELLPLLEAASAAKPRPLIACSVRDLLQAKPQREAEVLALVERFFDRILVHGDPRLAGFELTFSRARELERKLRYTGYVVQERAENSTAGAGEVIVSAGGGAVGRRLLETALAARRLVTGEAPWRVLTGTHGPDLSEMATSGVVIERSRNDFPSLLANCRVSVSQAGYNTVCEVLQARARAVLVPFAGDGESEQTLRARLLSERGWAQMLPEEALDAAALASAVERAASHQRPPEDALDLRGAARTAELLLQ